MSALSIYLDQITRPSFLPTYAAPTRRPAHPAAAEKRRQVLDCLRQAGKAVTAAWVIDYTGYTKQSVMHLLYGLQDEGLVKRSDLPGTKVPGVSSVFWEATNHA